MEEQSALLAEGLEEALKQRGELQEDVDQQIRQEEEEGAVLPA